MLEDFRSSPILARAVHVILLLAGVLLLFLGVDVINPYWQSVIVNLGSSLISVTVVFLAYRIFTPSGSEPNNISRATKQDPDTSTNTTNSQKNNLANELRNEQTSNIRSVVSQNKKVKYE